MPYHHHSLENILRTTAWTPSRDDPECRPFETHSDETRAFVAKDAQTVVVVGTPAPHGKDDNSFVVGARLTKQRIGVFVLFSLLVHTLVLSAITLGLVTENGQSPTEDDCASEIAHWKYTPVVNGTPESHAVIVVLNDGTYRAHGNYDGSGVGRANPCLHLVANELTVNKQVIFARRSAIAHDGRQFSETATDLTAMTAQISHSGL